MVITQTPFRMAFFGGGTDMPEFFNEYGGAVISTAIDKYCYVTVRHLPPFFDYYTELAYAKIERVTDIEKIEHPAVRNAMKMLDIHDIRLTYEADLPARSGLGTSSSFAVGMLEAFYAIKNKTPDKRKLAEDAIYLERELCKEAGGWQDQIAAAYGGFNRIDFKDNSFEVKPIAISAKRRKSLEENILVFFTGFTRLSSEIQAASKKVEDKTSQLKQMLELVDEAEKILIDEGTSLDEFGRLLDITWRLKRQTGDRVSTSKIDELYEMGIKAGATGGKLLGAGGGGFLAFYVPKEKQESVRAALSDLLYIPLGFDDDGTKIIHLTPETYSYRGAEK